MNGILSRFGLSDPKSDSEWGSSGALPTLFVLIIIGYLGIGIYAFQFNNTYIGILSVGVLVASAGLVLGGFIGFLFGIPRTLADDRSQSNDVLRNSETTNTQVADFRANTNLEEISDWLTKILVGVGLTQLSNIPQTLNQAANVIQESLGSPPQNHTFSLAILVYFPICGFLGGYLWTRLFLPGVFTKAEAARLRDRERKLVEENAIYTVAQTIENVPVQEVGEERSFGLWVDDNPSNNAYLKESLENLLRIKFDLSFSTEDAIEKLDAKQYGVIISDMGRPPDPQAGYTLLRFKNSQPNKNRQTPFILYASGASIPRNQEKARMQQAYSTSSPQELLQLVKNALSDGSSERTQQSSNELGS